MSTQGASTSSSSSSSIPWWKYDVFLSFRGADTRKSFTDHLYDALKRKGIFTFRDDEKLERGKSISQELLKAIEESRIAIVIFSKNYASSTWCLDELVHIVRCKKETDLEVVPVFYGVNPSDVRNQTKAFAPAVMKHEHFKESIEKVEKWRAALREVGELAGWDLQDRHESEFIQDIVEKVMKKLSTKFSSVSKKLVGIESMVAQLITSYLGIGNNVYMVGICGMGGLGKTTLARAVYDMYSDHFQGSSFIADVREKSEKGGLLRLQQQLLEELWGEKKAKIWDVHQGVNIIKNRLHSKKVLLVLDDVNHVDQLEKLAGEHDWFGLGSWIIITTRDKHVLVEHGVLNIYKPYGLNNDDASKLFCLKAFKNEQPKEGYMQLSQGVVKYANGLPLALVTMGSFLVGRTIDEWQSALDNFKKNPKKEIFDILKISYDGLEETWKEIFLDIACLFRGQEKDQVIQILESCGFDARIGISVLVDKSLLTITNNPYGEFLDMHDLLKEMGEKIVRLNSCGELGRQSRLWHLEDLFCVLENDMATEDIQAIVFKYGKEDFNFEELPGHFSKMSGLRLLIINDRHIPNALNHVPNGLRHLQWRGCSLKYLPSNFQPKELVHLDLQGSEFEYLWEGVKFLGKLKYINLDRSNLIRTPDFSGVPRLEVLKLSWCSRLVEIHPSIGQLSKLRNLVLRGCISLTNLPSMSAEMESLTVLNLHDCSEFRKFPTFMGIMKSLSELHLGKTAINELPPSSIECLTALTLLDLEYCNNLKCLPSNMNNLRSLEKLVIFGCSNLANLPENIWKIRCLKEFNLSGTSELKEIGLNGTAFLSSLIYLTLSWNNFVTLPASINQLSKLEALDLHHCEKLQSVPELPSTVRYINVEGCFSLKPSLGLLRGQRPWAREPYYNESGSEVAFEILNLYLQGLLHAKTGYETSMKRKKDEFQIVFPGFEIPSWSTHQRVGNSVSIDLPPNWCNSRWMGFALCTSFNVKVFPFGSYGLRARVIALGDKPHSHYTSEIFFTLCLFCACHIWLLYLSRDSWFATVGNGECSQIEVVFETSTPHLNVQRCGVSLVYEQELNQAIAKCSSSSIITYEGWDGFHNSTRSCDG